MKSVTKQTLIGDILALDPGTEPYFMAMGMQCLYCPASRGETLEEACVVHGIDVEEMVQKLNEFLASHQ